MIPIRDSVRQRHLPFVNYLLIALCGAAFAWELRAGPMLEDTLQSYALIPARFLALGERGGFFQAALYTPFITSTFLHAGAAHFLTNMLFLWTFGGNVEHRLGHLGYPMFYLAGGWAAGFAHVAANPSSVIPTIGASGAIAAVMGAYFLLYPRAWIRSFVPPFFWLRFEIPAVLYLALWFGLQLYMGSLALNAEAGGVAWWAHAGGFAFGAGVIMLIGRRRPSAQ